MYDEKTLSNMLTEAIARENPTEIDEAIALGANVNDSSFPGPIIEYALEHGSASVIKHLVANGMKTQYADENSLVEAVINGNADAVEYLIENGLVTHGLDYLFLALAIHKNDFETVARVFNSDVKKIIGSTSYDDGRLSIFASRLGYIDIVKLFIENRVDVNTEEEIMLETAAFNGHMDVVKYLVENGTDFRTINSAINTANNKEIIEYLRGQMIKAIDMREVALGILKKYPTTPILMENGLGGDEKLPATEQSDILDSMTFSCVGKNFEKIPFSIDSNPKYATRRTSVELIGLDGKTLDIPSSSYSWAKNEVAFEQEKLNFKFNMDPSAIIIAMRLVSSTDDGKNESALMFLSRPHTIAEMQSKRDSVVLKKYNKKLERDLGSLGKLWSNPQASLYKPDAEIKIFDGVALHEYQGSNGRAVKIPKDDPMNQYSLPKVAIVEALEPSADANPETVLLVGESVYDKVNMTLGTIDSICENGDILLRETQDWRTRYTPEEFHRLETLKAGKFYVAIELTKHQGNGEKIKGIVDTEKEADELSESLLEQYNASEIRGAFYIEGKDQYCVTAVFDDIPGDNHTMWFSTYAEAKAYEGTLGDGNIAIGKALSDVDVKDVMSRGKEVCFIFEDGTESVYEEYEDKEIEEVYKGLPLATYSFDPKFNNGTPIKKEEKQLFSTQMVDFENTNLNEMTTIKP